MAGIAGFGIITILDEESGLAIPMRAGRLAVTWTPTIEEVVGVSDCDASAVQTVASIERQLVETIAIDSGRVNDHTLQLMKGKRMATNVAGIRYLKTACITVPTPPTGNTVTITSATVPALAGLLAADTSSVTGEFQIAEGNVAKPEIVTTAPAAANQIQIQDNGVIVHGGNAGQTLLLQFTTVGTLTKAIGGPVTAAQGSTRIESVGVHGLVELLNGGGRWRYWAPSVRQTDARTLDPTQETNTYSFTASTPTGWSDQSLLYQFA